MCSDMLIYYCRIPREMTELRVLNIYFLKVQNRDVRRHKLYSIAMRTAVSL